MSRGSLAGGRRTRFAYGNCMAPWPLAPTRPGFTSTRSNIFPLDGIGLRLNMKFRYPRLWIRRPCVLWIPRSSRNRNWPLKIRVQADRRRFPLPPHPRVGARSPSRRESLLHLFAPRVPWYLPNPRALRRPRVRPEKPRGMEIGNLSPMVSGTGEENSSKCVLRIFFFAPKSGFWGWVDTPSFK